MYTDTVGQLAPSSYCNVLIEALLLPVVEAAAGLSEGGQRSFVGVAISIFTNELRRAIVCNTLTYTYVRRWKRFHKRICF